MCRLTYIMKNIWRRLRGYEKVTGNEIIPCDALLCELMYHHDLDERVMVNVVMLLRWDLLLHKNRHPLYVMVHEIWNAHQPHSHEMHQKSDVIRIQA